MLPWVYNADDRNNAGRNDRTNKSFPTDNGGQEGYLNDYYQQYENDQKKMHEMQMDALKKKQANKNSRSRSGSRGRHRSRSRSRGRYRSRSRDRGDRRRSRSRERRYRGRSRSRTRSRSPRRFGRRSRSRSPCRDSAPVPPSNKLALMNLPKDITRDLIASILASTGFHPMDIRVIHKNSDRGAARSFGFIDFPDVATAIRWMDTTKGRLTLPDGRWISVHYSKPETTLPGGRPSGDWICASCTVMNFVKRDVCHKCDTSRTQSDEMERQGVHMIGVSGCDTLLIRDLPHAVTTTDIFNGLVKNTPLKSIIQLQLSESKLFAYIQMKSVDEATLLFDSSYKAPIQVLDKNVIMTYCRVPLSHMMRQGNQTSGYDPKLAVDWASAQTSSSGAEVAAAAMMRVHQRQAPSSHAQQQNFYTPSTAAMTYPPPVVNSNYSVPPPSVSYGYGIDTSVPPPAASKPTQHPAPPVQNGIVGIVPTPRGVMPQYVVPNPATFQYEPTTGYFLDPTTNFYYDAKTTYYYNSETRQWMYYDSTYSTYFQAQEEEPVTTSEENIYADIAKPDEAKVDDSKKSASDIAKEMHKWAKKQEKQKLQITMKPLVKTLETKSAFASIASSSKSEDAVKVLDKSKNPLGSMSDDEDDEDPYKKQSSSEKIDVPPPMNLDRSGTFAEPVRQKVLPSAEEQRELMERALIDENKKMCLLCKRAFPSVDVLRKHVEKSDLHKKNLEEKRVEWGQQYMASIKSVGDDNLPGLPVPEPVPKMVYRDRAKERRKQYGIDGGYGRDVPSGATKTDEEVRKESEEVSRRPIDSSNIGNKLLKSMGWKEGQGAGKFGQGIVNPIEAERRVEGAGLGSSGSRIMHGVEATHKERVRASFFNRYKEMQ